MKNRYTRSIDKNTSASHLFTSPNFNEHLTVVKGIRDLPSWSVKTSTSGRTSTDPLSFQTPVTSTSISQLSHLINFTLQFKSRSNFAAPVPISVPEATRSLEYFEVSFSPFLLLFISSSLFLILSLHVGYCSKSSCFKATRICLVFRGILT